MTVSDWLDKWSIVIAAILVALAIFVAFMLFMPFPYNLGAGVLDGCKNTTCSLV